MGQRTRHALVVDDSVTVRRAIRRMIEPMGFTVSEAADGNDALDQYTRHYPDVVFLDVEMPGMDGLTVLRQLRGAARVMWTSPESDDAGAPSARPCIIMCTSHVSFDTIQVAMDAGADEYIMKPFDAHVLSDKLHLCGLA
jgi:two-component system chemotaxis response regulator CheY